MAIIESASRDALFVITILRLIPRNKWISTTEIKQALGLDGDYEVVMTEAAGYPKAQ